MNSNRIIVEQEKILWLLGINHRSRNKEKEYKKIEPWNKERKTKLLTWWAMLMTRITKMVIHQERENKQQQSGHNQFNLNKSKSEFSSHPIWGTNWIRKQPEQNIIDESMKFGWRSTEIVSNFSLFFQREFEHYLNPNVFSSFILFDL